MKSDPAAFLRANLPLCEVTGTGGVRLHLAGPKSRLSRLVPAGGRPYWAHAWPGGLALAAHIVRHPGIVAGRRVLDLASGSGLVAVAAARAGASHVTALDDDPLATVAAGLNAAANGVVVEALTADALKGPLLHAEVVLVGDFFYETSDPSPAVALRLEAYHRSGALVLAGDIGRERLPRDRLEPVAAYPVRDLGDTPATAPREGWVYRWRDEP